MNLGRRRERRREGKKAIGLEVFARDEGARGENWKFGVSQPSISASRFTLSYRTSPFGRDLANNNACLVAQNPRNSTLVAAKCLDWRGTIQSRATRYWFKQSSSSPSPPKVGVELLQLFYRRSCKVFYGRAGETGGGGGGGGVTRWPWVIKIAGDGSMLSRINGGNSPRDGTIWLLYVLHPGYCCLPNFAARSPYEFLESTIFLLLFFNAENYAFFKDFLGSKISLYGRWYFIRS